MQLHRRQFLSWCALSSLGGLLGCGSTNPGLPPMNPATMSGFGPAVPMYSAPQPLPTQARNGVQVVNNPLLIPVADRELAHEMIVDVVDSYFKIEREERIRQIGDTLTEGRIETFPQTAATIFEPWRGDSVMLYDRWESTLQTYRRRATLRIIPDNQALQIEVVVLKELEDVARPAYATAGAATLRHDSSPDRRTEPEPVLGRQVGDDPRPVANARAPLGWIPRGRDLPLEQELLIRIAEKLQRGNAALRAGQIVPNPNDGLYFAPPPAEAPGLLSPNGNATVPGLPPNNAHIGLPPNQ
jgi:hypothetical protein